MLWAALAAAGTTASVPVTPVRPEIVKVFVSAFVLLKVAVATPLASVVRFVLERVFPVPEA